MKRFQKFLPHCLAAIVGVVMLGAPSAARAAFNIYLQEAGVNGGLATIVASGADFTSASFSGTYGDFKVTVLGGASDNGATLSDLLSSTTAVQNTSGTTATLRLYVSQTNYTLPAGPLLSVESGMGGTVNTGVLSPTGIFQAYADKGNNLMGMSDFTNNPQNDTQVGSTFDTGSAFGLFSRTGDYSLTSEATLTLTGGGKVNYSDHINVVATPAPAGLVLALSGVPVLGLGRLLRRRKAAMPV